MSTYSVAGDSQAQGLIAAGLLADVQWLSKKNLPGANSERLLGLVREALDAGVPEVFVVVAGGNDVYLREARREPAWRAIVDLLRSRGIRKIIWVGPPASTDNALDSRRRLVSEQQRAFFGPLGVLWLDGRTLAEGLPYQDDVHLTAAGYREYAARLGRRLGTLAEEPARKEGGQGGTLLLAGLAAGAIAYWFASRRGGGFGELGRTKQIQDARDELVAPAEARKRIDRRGYPVPLDELPKHIRPYADFMVRSSKRPLRARDIVKAYVITRSSVQRQAAKYGTLCRYFPELVEFQRAYSTEKVRPEDAMSYLLLSKGGKRFLDKVSQGDWDYETAKSAYELSAQTKCFGFSYDLLLDMRQAAALARKSDEISAALRTLSPDQWVKYVQKNIPGISGAKAGFFAALLGRGDVPTFDARELKLWRKDRKSGVDVKPVDVMALRQKIARWPMRLDPEHEPFRQHLVHHALWDAYPETGEPTQTTHAEVIKALELAGLKRRK